MTTEHRLKGWSIPCANCRKPGDAHCSIHLIPCCPGKCPGQIEGQLPAFDEPEPEAKGDGS